MDNIDLAKVKKKYNSISEIWDINDKWHTVTHNMIKTFIEKNISTLPEINELKILNAGSAGNSYGLNEANITHIDIADEKLKNLSNSIIGSIENIPVPASQFDLIICVGSVINYCDPIKVIEEFKRVLKKGGKIVLEYENSNTLELIATKNFNKKVVLVDSFYFGKERIWFFSENWIKDILFENGMTILSKNKCHILSPLVYRITKNEKFATFFSIFDSFAKRIPLLRSLSSNTIIFVEQ